MFSSAMLLAEWYIFYAVFRRGSVSGTGLTGLGVLLGAAPLSLDLAGRWWAGRQMGLKPRIQPLTSLALIIVGVYATGYGGTPPGFEWLYTHLLGVNYFLLLFARSFVPGTLLTLASITAAFVALAWLWPAAAFVLRYVFAGALTVGMAWSFYQPIEPTAAEFATAEWSIPQLAGEYSEVVHGHPRRVVRGDFGTVLSFGSTLAQAPCGLLDDIPPMPVLFHISPEGAVTTAPTELTTVKTFDVFEDEHRMIVSDWGCGAVYLYELDAGGMRKLFKYEGLPAWFEPLYSVLDPSTPGCSLISSDPMPAVFRVCIDGRVEPWLDSTAEHAAPGTFYHTMDTRDGDVYLLRNTRDSIWLEQRRASDASLIKREIFPYGYVDFIVPVSVAVDNEHIYLGGFFRDWMMVLDRADWSKRQLEPAPLASRTLRAIGGYLVMLGYGRGELAVRRPDGTQRRIGEVGRNPMYMSEYDGQLLVLSNRGLLSFSLDELLAP